MGVSENMGIQLLLIENMGKCVRFFLIKSWGNFRQPNIK